MRLQRRSHPTLYLDTPENRAEARPFAVPRWIREGRGVLFLPYKAAMVMAARPERSRTLIGR
jgi:hypothetical protein